MTKIKYLSLTKGERKLVDIGNFFKNFGKGIVNFFKSIPNRLLKLWHKLCKPFDTLAEAWKKGSTGVKLNFFLMGFYQVTHHNIIRGVLYFLYEVVFIIFMIMVGGPYLGKLGSLGSFSQNDARYLVDVYEGETLSFVNGDFSFQILLYSIITFILMIIFVALWYFSIRDAKSLQDNWLVGKVSKDGQFFDDILNKDYHTLLLAVPMVGLVGFTVIPVVFMIIASFTNYSSRHFSLFDWTGFDNYGQFFSATSNGSVGLSTIFLQVLAWTMIWALIATFTNYFLGMAIALLINKKGIKLKKLWRTVLILTIAVPQFVSLLLINQMLSSNGILTELFRSWGWVTAGKETFDNVMLARIIIIIVNMWVGVPYTMLISSGLLMNIPEDLYESARIDGASPFKMFSAITLPYMLFITGPYLLSQFIGNINNFNIIFLLSGGNPSMQLSSLGFGDVGKTDILITWIYKMSMTGDTKNFAVACALGVLVFVIIAIFSLISYGRSNAVKNEEDFQ